MVVRSGLRSAEGLYVAAVGALAVLGAVHGDALFSLLAVALTLPFGVPALVLVYGGYAVLKGVGGLLVPATRPDGSDAAWLTAGSAALNVALLLGAALANVLLLEHTRRRRRRPAPR